MKVLVERIVVGLGSLLRKYEKFITTHTPTITPDKIIEVPNPNPNPDILPKPQSLFSFNF